MSVDAASFTTVFSVMSSIPALSRPACPASSPRRSAFPARQRVSFVLEIVSKVPARVVAVFAVVVVLVVVAVEVVLAVVVVALEAGRRGLAGRREIHRVCGEEGKAVRLLMSSRSN